MVGKALQDWTLEEFNVKICFSILKRASPGLFDLIFVIYAVDSKYVHYKILPMTGFELRTTDI